MAMKFGGFTPQQMQLLLPKLGYKGSMQTDEIDMFLAASPRAASQLGRFTETARQMVEGKPVNQTRNMANGGFVFPRRDNMGNVNRLNPQDNPEYSESLIDIQAAAVNKLENTFPTPQQEEQRRFAVGGMATPLQPQVIREGDPRIPMSFEEYRMSRPVGPGSGFTFPSDEELRPKYQEYADFVRSGAPEPTARPDPNQPPSRWPGDDQGVPNPVSGEVRPPRQPVGPGGGGFYRSQYNAAVEAARQARANGDITRGIMPGEMSYEDFAANRQNMERLAGLGFQTQTGAQSTSFERNPAYRPPQAGAQPPAQAVDNPAAAFLNATQQQYSEALASQQAARDALAADAGNENLLTALTAADSRVAQLNEAVTQAQDQFKQTSMPTPAELIQQSTVDPLSLVTQGYTQTTDAGQAGAGTIAAGSGQAGATTAATALSGQAATATGPTVTPTSTATVTASETGVKETTAAAQASQGQVSSDATVQAAQLSPSQLAQLALTPSQIAQAAQVQTPPSRNLAGGELVTGSAVDMATVKAETNFAAATGAPSTDATVQGQLTQLMADFEGGNQPTWAAGAMRAATAAMAQRGLGASSMAGQALIQAAMESALPIAQMDAAAYARFEEQSLSNRQQTAMFAAEKRAQFLGVDFTQEFQTRVSNASRVADIANVNFSAQQQVALENAQLTQSVDLANLNASNAKVMADAAALSQTDLTNLNNRQQAQVQNAKSFLDMEMSNMTNSQQMEMFKSQAVINSLMSDSAAANATAQFNASSENQVNQFFSNLSTQVSQFNGEQQNSLLKFNLGEANAIEEFNATQVNFRDQFNAQNALIIDQANAQWYQNIATTDNAAINQSNRDAAAQANNMSSIGFSAYMQEVRDLMSFAWQTSNNDADRATTLATASLSKEAAEAAAKANKSAGLWGAIGSVAAAILRPV